MTELHRITMIADVLRAGQDQFETVLAEYLDVARASWRDVLHWTVQRRKFADGEINEAGNTVLSKAQRVRR